MNLSVQVSVNPTGCFHLRKSKHSQHKENYFRDYYQKHREALLIKRKARYLAKKNTTQYGTNGVEQFFPHTRNDSLNSPHTPVVRLHARDKNFVFLFNTTPEGQSGWARQKRKDQPWRRLATKNKIAQVAGYNLPTYKEKRSIEELLKKHAEFAYLTGKPLGRYYLSTLDLDLRKVEFPEKMVVELEKNAGCLLGSLRVSYDKTKKGLHVDILTPEPLPNEIIYYQGWGESWNVGSIQSQGKYVVGEDKEKEFVKNGKWYWKVENGAEIRAKLAKFFFMAGKQREVVVNKPSQMSTTKNIQSQKVVDRSALTRLVQTEILSKQKIPQLTDFVKIWYKNLSVKQQPSVGYFLLNTYQRPEALSDLNVGSVRNVCLVSGRKHDFFGRISRASFLTNFHATKSPLPSEL